MSQVVQIADRQTDLFYGHPLMNKLIEAMREYEHCQYEREEWVMQVEYILSDHELPTTDHNIRTMIGWIL